MRLQESRVLQGIHFVNYVSQRHRELGGEDGGKIINIITSHFPSWTYKILILPYFSFQDYYQEKTETGRLISSGIGTEVSFTCQSLNHGPTSVHIRTGRTPSGLQPS